ncbi:flagellar basal body L-ring protein FlgH [Niveibacterium sp. 24ML]|uniref:flagellar basal body L-ring protein FlgH n=1 Tax=Niveibacterium sp. 24ML TaxID=2985512 RepID=UPI0022718092|nr:flagellar basal body L-ring protein FlgH [Niveibacterium sp. 24ML]MCX9157953.1 flagellar basal body L-ring protein FlgH [Niveibacterium sp. 24ML]
MCLAKCSRLALAAAVLLLGACVTPPMTNVQQPMSTRPQPRPVTEPVGGSLFSTNAGQRGMFEDRRARMVGDTLTINLVEKTAATKNANSSASRESEIGASVPTMSKVPLKYLQGLDLAASTNNTFAGKGASSANNNFTGTITVTVIDVYPNGNLLVSGEKRVAINQGDEFIRFSGVVSPMHVTVANAVDSTKVADARIEYKGSGYIDDAQQMGWLARFFQVITPF